MITKHLQQLCDNLGIPVPAPSSAGEYFIAFENMQFVIIQDMQDAYVVWTQIMNMPSNTLRFDMELQNIGEISLSLLAGLTSSYFPVPFLVGYELRLGIKIGMQERKSLLSACTILLEDADFWKRKCNVRQSVAPVPLMRGILKF